MILYDSALIGVWMAAFFGMGYGLWVSFACIPGFGSDLGFSAWSADCVVFDICD